MCDNVINININDLGSLVEKTLLKESYGISELVSLESDLFIDDLNERIENRLCSDRGYYNPEIPGTVRRIVCQYNRLFFNEFSIRVDLDVCVADNEEILFWYANKAKLKGNDIHFSPDPRVLTFKIFGLSKTVENFRFNKFGSDFEGLIEHELKHAYQTYLKHGAFSISSYESDKTNNLRNRQRQGKAYAEGVDDKKLKEIFTVINQVVYYSFKTEQTAFEQEIYRNIINHTNSKNEVYEYIKTLDFYQDFEKIKVLKKTIEDNEEIVGGYLENIYGKSLKWFYSVLDYTVKKMRYVINRSIWNAMGFFGSRMNESLNKKIFLL